MKKGLMVCIFLACAGPCDASLADLITKNDVTYYTFIGLESVIFAGFALGTVWNGCKTITCVKKIRSLKRLIQAKRLELKEQRGADEPVDYKGFEKLLWDLKKARLGVCVYSVLTAICPLGALISFHFLYHSWIPKETRDVCRVYTDAYRTYSKSNNKESAEGRALLFEVFGGSGGSSCDYKDKTYGMNSMKAGLERCKKSWVAYALFLQQAYEDIGKEFNKGLNRTKRSFFALFS